MNPELNKTDVRRQRNLDYDDDEETQFNNTPGKDPKYRTHVGSDDFDIEEPTDKDGNVSIFFCTL
jgi:hypothetical protein